MRKVEIIIKKITSFCYIFLLSISLFPIIFFLINIRDSILGKNAFFFKNSHNKYYKVPLITYFSSFITIGILVGLITSIHADYISKTHQIELYIIVNSYLCSAVVYLLAFYFGMYRRFSEDKNSDASKSVFLEILSIHRQFLNLSFIPLTFVITLIGIISSLKIPINISIHDINSYINNISNYMIKYLNSGNFLIQFLGFVLNLTILVVLFYIFTLPLQLAALFINYVFKYFYEYGSYYKDIYKDYDIH
ncbi:hypothetical protein RN70_00400 [Staphylococcus schleiferi]|uniref:hypothetical protein n=1 Tax=Staphylococcus coagulans TaxID=74706 RepID=UPI00067A429F|nr:hypothetical protein [Staphylococcus coagulans]AKS70346.1 hypothetical protein OA96_00230 [Staphylococcus schleiferi]AKS72495.1 hypothetical protein RN70_00400 [Staphylococcus schleiferi]MBT2832759.1 hypothetical protein [Staphylococcus coagulans]